LPQLQSLPPEVVQWLERLGRFVRLLRLKHRLSLASLAAQTGLAEQWLALLEQGVLLPEELTDERLRQVGQVLRPQRGEADPATLFATLAQRLRHVRLPDAEPVVAEPRPSLLDRVVQWLSPLWHPPLAGEPVTAADTSEQAHVFMLDVGEIHLTCAWWPGDADTAAGLRLAWSANITQPGDLWVRFTRPENAAEVLAECLLGEELAGEQIWLAHDLGFDPTRVPWALHILLTEPLV
jgi:transcriptional regulator with XRE-family HTH domain